MLHAQIKEHTRIDHAALEKKLIQRILKIEDKIDYVALLLLLYSYYSAVEKKIHPFVSDSCLTDYGQRRKADKIRNDITSLLPDTEPNPNCAYVPEIRSYFSALGALYVLEGSTLGGQIIKRMITAKLKCEAGFTFFQSYGDDVEAMWIKFKTYLEGPFSSSQEAEILVGAKQTFQTFNQWLSTHDQN